MASYKVRGTKHNVIFNYKAPQSGEQKMHWESYLTAREAIQRKTYIDYLQKERLYDEIYNAVLEYRDQQAAITAEKEAEKIVARYGGAADEPPCPYPRNADNTGKTYREFAEEWLPFHSRKKRYSPSTYDSYHGILTAHVLPYFGERIMSRITARDIDAFVYYLSYKPVKGTQFYGVNPDELTTLSSSVIKKAHQVLMSGFPTAKKWGFTREIPVSTMPTGRYNRRKSWTSKEVFNHLSTIRDTTLHLAVHLAFVCSLRAGEVAGISLSSIDLDDKSLWITQEVQRVSDRALDVLPKNEIICLFPKQSEASKSRLALKAPKTDGSFRKVYLTTPLCEEIAVQISWIEKNRQYMGEEYSNYELLLCRPDGFPLEPQKISKKFQKWQAEHQINNPISFHGLRKSGQMHKVRLSQNNYQLVAEAAGHTPRVLMAHYNEVFDSEKRALVSLVEDNFYTV